MKVIYFIGILFLSAILYGQDSFVNTAHLDHLYEEVIVNDDTLGIIHIYSEYPDYHWVDDDDEGTACVDDAARAMIFYLEHHQLTKAPACLNKTKKLLNFLFYMQAENGFFYNFIWKDNTINKEFKTSVAEPNWWSWRALWALTEANRFFRDTDRELTRKIQSSINKLLKAALPVLDRDETYGEFSGLRLPLWLPYESAADQAAVIIKGLSLYFETEKDSSVLIIIKKLSRGLLQMQAGDEDTPPYYAFLSWQNTWHAWGNSQSDALLTAGTVLNDTSLINAALNEIKYFYPYLGWQGYLSDFSIRKKNELTEFVERNPFSQIAYGFRPIIFASLRAYEITNDVYYAELAGSVASWFFGKNRLNTPMYDPRTGTCYDGMSEGKINKNSGAESTIEALFSILKVENNPAAKGMLLEEIETMKNE